ncbi:MAG TPA: hypothetical protein VF503_12130 [Sphingobium sp.]|uniref:hypothetical protein n=1 Tax=Sphingobium sp. TaxID=1912891 RepID=UPI002ED2B1C3
MTVTLTLGDFTFARYEIPEEIGFGGDQALTVHRLVGGVRVIDAMGEDPAALEWSGYLVGSSALDRARYLDTLRKAGTALPLSWSQLAYTVVIRSFRPVFIREYRLSYRITCEVVSDDTSPVSQVPDPSPEQLIDDDLSTANGLVGGIGDGTLSGLMAGVNSAISTVSNIANATTSAINSVLQPIQAVRDRVGVLLQAATTTINNVASVGGVLPSNPIAQQVLGLTNQISAFQSSTSLVELDGVMGRLASNVSAVGTGTKSVTLAGGNLYSLASSEYGNPMGWAQIAAANGIVDPSLTGINTLTIPPIPSEADGILNG